MLARAVLESCRLGAEHDVAIVMVAAWRGGPTVRAVLLRGGKDRGEACVSESEARERGEFSSEAHHDFSRRQPASMYEVVSHPFRAELARRRQAARRG